jgi:hypothetical protein
MKGRFPARRRVGAWALAAAAAAIPARANADSSPASQCIAAAEQSQPLRDHGKLRAAREKLLTCSRPECPSFVRTDCTKWLADLDGVMPKIVFSAVDSAGADLVDVGVWLDGEQVARRLDGSEVEIDPGPHTVRFEHAGSAQVEQQIVINVGDRHRIVLATFSSAGAPLPAALTSPAPPEPVTPEGRRSLLLPIALIGVGAAGVGVASYFWLSGLADHSSMGTGCAVTHSCSQSAVDAGQAKLVAGDVAGGLGLVAAAIGTGILVFGSSHPQAGAAGGAMIGIRPVAGGGAVDVVGRF